MPPPRPQRGSARKFSGCEHSGCKHLTETPLVMTLADKALRSLGNVNGATDEVHSFKRNARGLRADGVCSKGGPLMSLRIGSMRSRRGSSPGASVARVLFPLAIGACASMAVSSAAGLMGKPGADSARVLTCTLPGEAGAWFFWTSRLCRGDRQSSQDRRRRFATTRCGRAGEATTSITTPRRASKPTGRTS